MLLDTALKGRIASANKGDSTIKSMAKTVSWRILGTLDTIVISYFITGETAVAVSIGSVEVVSKMILYYFHERAWAQVKIKK